MPRPSSAWLALLIGVGFGLPALAQGPVDLAGPPPRPAGADTAAAEAEALAASDESLLTDGALDDLVAPVALYPDALLAQVLVAATVPLDLVKADRFLDDNPDLDDAARAEAAEAGDWDASVQVLVAGFPSVVAKMADDIDWTERLGEAMLAQTDGVLDAVQRQRARAEAVGNLESNDAQTVSETDGDISIAPTDPGQVYVPTYDPAMAFTSAAPVVVDDGMNTSDLLVTGAIAFGSAMLVDEIFDDDDWDDDWDNYWHGPPPFDWDDGDFYPRGDVDIDIEGDVNIDRDRIDNIANRVDDLDPAQRQELRDHIENRDRLDPAQRDAMRQRLADNGNAGLLDEVDALDPDQRAALRDRVDGRTPGAGVDPDRAAAARERIGAREPGTQPPGSWQPPAEAQQAARAKIAARTGNGDGASRAAAREKLEARGGGSDDLRARVGAAAAAGAGASGLKAATDLRPRSDQPISALKPAGGDAKRAAAAASRGRSSLEHRDGGGGAALGSRSGGGGQALSKGGSRPVAISKPKGKISPSQHRSPSSSSAFQRQGNGGAARAASARGGKHGGGGGGGRRGGGGGRR